MKPVVKFRQGESVIDVAIRAKQILSLVDDLKASAMIERIMRATSTIDAWRILGEYVTLVVQN